MTRRGVLTLAQALGVAEAADHLAEEATYVLANLDEVIATWAEDDDELENRARIEELTDRLSQAVQTFRALS
jgi:transposase